MAPISSLYDDDRPTIRDWNVSTGTPDRIASPISGSISALPLCLPSCQIDSATPHSLRPEQKFSVPSIGSRIAIQLDDRSMSGT